MSDDTVPHSEIAERAVLGAIFDDPSVAMPQVARTLEPDLFWSARNRLIASTIWTMHMAGDPVDLVTVRARMDADGTLTAAGGADYVQGLVDGSVSASQAGYYGGLVAEKGYRRAVLLKSADLVSACRNGADPAAVLEALALIPRPGGNIDRVYSSIMSYDQLRTAELPDTLPILGDSLLVRRDYGIIAARKGIGKTWLALQLGVAVSTGEPWLQWPTVRGRVLVYSLEMSRDKLRSRIHAIAPDRDLPDLYLFGRDSLAAHRGMSPIPKLARPEAQAEMLGVIDRLETDLLIVDPIGPSMECEGQELEIVAAFFSDLVARTGISAVLTHHLRKPQQGAGSDDDMASIRNASQFVDRACCVMVLKKSKGGLVLTQAADPRHCETPADIWLERRPCGVLEMTDAPTDSGEQAAERQARLRMALEDEGGEMATTDAMAFLGIGRDATIRHLKAIGAAQIGHGRAAAWKLESSPPKRRDDRADDFGLPFTV